MITALHALFDQVCGYLSGSLRISDLTSMIVDKQTKDTTKSMHKMTFADVKENVRRMVQDHEDGGVEYYSDIDNLASLESMTLILDQGFAKSFQYSEDVRIRYNHMKRLTGSDKLTWEILGDDVTRKESVKSKAGIMMEVSVWNWTLFSLLWETNTPDTHKGAHKEFSNHVSCSDYDLMVAKVAALPSLTENGMRELADDSFGRVISHLNVIPDVAYSADSTKNHPFSFREALITEKEELKKIVANEGRVIRSIDEACGGKGGTADVAAVVVSAKSTLVKNATFSASTKASERTILHLHPSLEQVQEHTKRLKVDLATLKGGGVMGGGGGGVGGGGVGGGGGRSLGRGGAAVGGLVVPDRARPFPSLFTLAKTVVPPVTRPGFLCRDCRE